MRPALLVLLPWLVVLATGCGSIQVVDRTPAGGTVALDGSHDAAEEKAEDYMRTACPFGYEVVSADETAIRFRCKAYGTDREKVSRTTPSSSIVRPES